ncbi:hypothetical protein C7B76_06235 [filamentous cyanobacterium CCP2]|nr:hypothetical protein C7B76_06235 [filamentous cyanobacterium CCP2]
MKYENFYLLYSGLAIEILAIGWANCQESFRVEILRQNESFAKTYLQFPSGLDRPSAQALCRLL